MAEQRKPTQRYLSGRTKVTSFAGLHTDRHLYVHPGEVEPNLGFPGEKSIPISNTYYRLVTIDGGGPYDRYWQAIPPATLVSGISIFDEGNLVGTANSVSKINFVGAAISATASGSISTVTVQLFLYLLLHLLVQTTVTSGGIVMKVNSISTMMMVTHLSGS